MIRIFPSVHDVLVPGVVGELVQNPAATLHLNGVAVAEVGAQVGAVSAALVLPSLEVLVLEEYNLGGGKQKKEKLTISTQHCSKHNNIMLTTK